MSWDPSQMGGTVGANAIMQEPEKIEKAAKATTQMFGSMLKTALYTLGLGQLFDKINDLANNPAIKVLQTFFEYLVANINAQFVELAQELAKNLFGPETQKNIKETTAAAKGFNDILAPLVKGLNTAGISILELIKLTSPLYSGFKLINAQFELQVKMLKDLDNAIQKTTKGLKDFIEKIDDFWETVRGD